MKVFARHSAFWMMLSLLLAPLAVSHAAPGPKIEGPWLWMIVPTGETGGPAAAASGIDWLAEFSGGSVPEQQVAQNGAVAGEPIGNKVWTWGELDPTSSNNVTDMVNAIGLGNGYITNHVAYGWIALDSPRQQNTTMYVGSDDAVKVWLNGVLVHNNPVDRGASDYQDAFPVTLRQGTNSLLVAVYQGEFYWSGFFGFANDAAYSSSQPSTAISQALVVADRFGRAVNDAGITLVDWEGHIANPAMQYTIKAPSTRVILSASEPRLYFNLPSWNEADGPRKELTLSGTTSSQLEFYISIFPDRDGLDETHSLTIEYRDTKNRSHTETIDIHVIDQDVPGRALDFDITVDFSHDETELFDDPAARADYVQAAEDLVYFFDDMDLDEVLAGQEQSNVWETRGYPHGNRVINKINYTGFLLYAYGVYPGTGGGPAHWSYQSANGVKLPLRRSGDTFFAIRGNRNELGWMTALSCEEWWKATNFGNVQNDLYSIAFHEIGHALAFTPGYDEFAKFKDLGYVNNPAVKNYYGSYPVVDRFSHLPHTVDPVSRRGAFGNEYGGEMPPGRWIITKGHILITEAIGYTFRATSPFIPLSITAAPLPEGTSGASYSYTATVSGGTPAYYWAIESGTLPAGLSIDSFTGTLSGIPRQYGTFNFTLSVSDCDETTPSITRAVTLIIREGEATPHSLTKVSGDGQGGSASTQLAAPLVVSVLDQDGSPLAGVSVSFAVSTGGGLLSSTNADPCTVESSKSSVPATTDAKGRAAIRLTLGRDAGTNTVAATVAGLEPATFTATAAEQASPHRLTKVCGDSQEGTVSEPLAKPFVVLVADENGSAIAGVVVSFAVTAGGGTLSAPTATTDANGRAATRLTLGSAEGPNTISATVGGLASATFTATGKKSAIAGLFDLFNQSGKLVALPDRTQLLPNAPNPFNSQTVLSYFLLEPGPVRLEVFALSGQRIAVLHQGPQQAGYHRLHWDGRDAVGRPVASGTYLYRMVTDETVLTRKLTLLR